MLAPYIDSKSLTLLYVIRYFPLYRISGLT